MHARFVGPMFRQIRGYKCVAPALLLLLAPSAPASEGVVKAGHLAIQRARVSKDVELRNM